MTLLQANEVRFGRIAIKQGIGTGSIDLRTVLEDPPACCNRVKLYDAIQWLPKVGPMRARQILMDALPPGFVSETITLERLSPKTRAELVLAIERYCTTAGSR